MKNGRQTSRQIEEQVEALRLYKLGVFEIQKEGQCGWSMGGE